MCVCMCVCMYVCVCYNCGNKSATSEIFPVVFNLFLFSDY